MRESTWKRPPSLEKPKSGFKKNAIHNRAQALATAFRQKMWTRRPALTPSTATFNTEKAESDKSPTENHN